jgi:hypothetical protein
MEADRFEDVGLEGDNIKTDLKGTRLKGVGCVHFYHLDGDNN